MKHILWITLLAWCYYSQAQTIAGGKTVVGGKSILGTGTIAAIPAPALVNFRGMESSETNAAAAKTFNTCASHAYCTQVVDPTLAGQQVIVFYKYKPASGNTADIPTVATFNQAGTATGDTYTHCGTDANNSTNNFYIGCYYSLAPSTGTTLVRVTWVNANTNLAVATATLKDTNAFDVYATSSGTAATTFTSGSATSTANGDLWFEMACGTSTITNVGAYTLGSQAGITWLGDLFDQRDACGIQHGIQTTAGALNPQFTGASNNFVALGFALKAGVAGSVPAGIHIVHLYTVSSASGGGNFSYQMPVATAGNLVVAMGLGGKQYSTAVSDATNGSWTSCGPPNLFGQSGSPFSTTFYFPNSAAGVLNLTFTNAGTGDIGPIVIADIAGAATTQQCNRWAPQDFQTGTGTSYSPVTNFAPGSSAGITLVGMSQGSNTSISTTAPAGLQYETVTMGGENLSGPWFPGQNNGVGEVIHSSNTPFTITFGQTDTHTLDTVVSEIVSFQATGATLYPIQVKEAGHANDSGTTAKLTSYVPYQAGDAFAIMACTTAASGTIIVTDGTNTYNIDDAAANIAGAGVRCTTVHALNVSASTVTITATFGTSAGFTDIMLEEIANVSTGVDQHALAADTAASWVYTSTSLTTTHANEAIAAFQLCGNCVISNNGGTSELNSGTNSGNWTQLTYDGQGNTMGHITTGATGTFAVHFAESNQGSISNVGATGMISFF